MASSIREQYDMLPVSGLRRFWISWFASVEAYPKTDFPYWETGHGTSYAIRPSKQDDPRAAELPPTIRDIAETDVAQADIDQFYYTENIFSGLIDAESETAIWEKIEQLFPGHQVRKCEPTLRETLTDIERTGRFKFHDAEPDQGGAMT